MVKIKLHMEQQNNLRAKFLKHGFIVLKSVFADSKIKELRDKFIKLSSTDDEILLDENAQDLLLDKDIIKKIKILLNSEKIWYYSDSSIKNYFNPFTAKNGFHNDERFASDEIPYKEEYPIIRAGIYFEDYKNFSGGLKIRDGSHKHFCFNLRAKLENIVRLLKIFMGKSRYDISAIKLGKKINLQLEEGDVVIWNLRTQHCGVSRRLKLFPRLCLSPSLEKMLPKSLFLPTQYKTNRCSIFSTFSKVDYKNLNIVNYIKNKADIKKISSLKKNDDLIKKFDELNIEIPNFI